jgi:hypothetical protein
LQQVARFGKKPKEEEERGGDGDDVHLIHEEEKKHGSGSGDIFGGFPNTQDIKALEVI